MASPEQNPLFTTASERDASNNTEFNHLLEAGESTPALPAVTEIGPRHAAERQRFGSKVMDVLNRVSEALLGREGDQNDDVEEAVEAAQVAEHPAVHVEVKDNGDPDPYLVKVLHGTKGSLPIGETTPRQGQLISDIVDDALADKERREFNRASDAAGVGGADDNLGTVDAYYRVPSARAPENRPDRTFGGGEDEEVDDLAAERHGQ